MRDGVVLQRQSHLRFQAGEQLFRGHHPGVLSWQDLLKEPSERRRPITFICSSITPDILTFVRHKHGAVYQDVVFGCMPYNLKAMFRKYPLKHKTTQEIHPTSVFMADPVLLTLAYGDNRPLGVETQTENLDFLSKIGKTSCPCIGEAKLLTSQIYAKLENPMFKSSAVYDTVNMFLERVAEKQYEFIDSKKQANPPPPPTPHNIVLVLEKTREYLQWLLTQYGIDKKQTYVEKEQSKKHLEKPVNDIISQIYAGSNITFNPEGRYELTAAQERNVKMYDSETQLNWVKEVLRMAYKTEDEALLPQIEEHLRDLPIFVNQQFLKDDVKQLKRFLEWVGKTFPMVGYKNLDDMMHLAFVMQMKLEDPNIVIESADDQLTGRYLVMVRTLRRFYDKMDATRVMNVLPYITLIHDCETGDYAAIELLDHMCSCGSTGSRLLYQCSKSLYDDIANAGQVDSIEKMAGTMIVDVSHDVTGNFDNYEKLTTTMPLFLHNFARPPPNSNKKPA